MTAGRKYPQELRERAVRMVVEARSEDPGLSLHQAVLRIGPRVGVVPDTLRGWIRQDQINAGERPARPRPSRPGCATPSGKTGS